MNDLNSPNFRLLKPYHLLLALAVFGGLFALSYPYYRYFVDPDAVAYLTMAKRAADHDPWRLVNALWSPLHPAMVAACVKFLGMDVLWAAQITNAIACGSILAISFALFRRFKISRDIGVPLLLAMSLFLVYALYKQLFCDLWQVGLLLLYILIITGEKFLHRPFWWLLCALVMALATYAKVYSFYFLLLHFPLSLFILWRKAGRPGFPWKQYGCALGFQVLLLLPLAFLMHEKYGFWGLSKSGALNTSWTLMGHKTPRQDIQFLIPPPYPNSPYTWEDPYISEGMLHGRFESIGMMKSQLGHTFQAGLQGVEAADQISAFLLIVLGASFLVAVFRKKQTLFNQDHKVILAAALIMPLGYLLLHFEARYIWLLLPITMILGAVWLNKFREKMAGGAASRIATLAFAVSFVIYPMYDMKALFRKGEDVYRLANALTRLNIRGSFTSNDNPSRSGCLAYWLGCNYFTPVKDAVKPNEMLADMIRYRVTFYFHHQNSLDIATAFVLDEHNQPAQRVDGGRIQGLQVFVIAP